MYLLKDCRRASTAPFTLPYDGECLVELSLLVDGVNAVLTLAIPGVSLLKTRGVSCFGAVLLVLFR